MILLHTFVAIAILCGLFDGIDREVQRYCAISDREDLIRRGYIL